jgi:hypothetical protein
MPTPSVGDPVAGQRERRVIGRLVTARGAELVVEVVSGGPPCEAVTGVDVTESTSEVRLAVWVGRTPTATGCDGPRPALAAIQWVRVPLSAPLGTRAVHADPG